MSAEVDLAKLERKVLAVGEAGRWLKAVDTLRKLLAMGDEEAVRSLVLVLDAPRVEAAALAAVLDAFALGATDALSILESAGISDIRRTGRPSKGALKPVKGLDKAGALELAKAVKLAKAGADIGAVVAPVFGHANRVQGSVSDAINRGGNEGSTRVADAAGLPTVWVAETDACVTCLAYSGRIANPGKSFPGGLTYGRKSYYPDAVETPPRHPRCRCTVEPLHAQEYADALRREADRSVLRGFSLTSESMKTRIEAADDLVKSEPDAPKSVIDYARKSVKRGAFTTRGRPAKS